MDSSTPPRFGRRASSVAITIALLSAAASCSSGGDERSASTADAASDAVGGVADARPELTIATSFAIDDLDPLDNGFWGPEFGYVELLMRPERDGRPSPWVLEELTVIDDTTWNLVLRDDVTFANGTPLDAELLARLIEFQLVHSESFAAAVPVDSVEATGATTVELTTRTPLPSLGNALADESLLPVFDVGAYETYVESGAAPSALIDAGLYTGPYEMTSLDEQAARLVPIDEHWGGTPALSSLTIKFVPEATSRVQAVQAGEADIALYMPTDVATALRNRDDAFYVTGEPTGTTFSLQLRNAGPYADIEVRRAVLSAIDYRELADDVMDGQAAVATSVFGPAFPYAVDTQVTDLDEARRLLDAAGWVGDGTRSRDGDDLRLRLLTYPQQPDSNTIAVALQAQLGDVGIDVEVTEVPDITVARESDEWDGAIVGDSLLSYSLSPEDGLADDLVTGGDQNFMQVSNAELDRLVAELSSEFEEDARNDLLVEIQRVIHDNGLWAATILRQPAVVTNAEWRGYETPLANMWVTAETAPRS